MDTGRALWLASRAADMAAADHARHQEDVMTLTAIARPLFWAALVFAVTMALLPHPPHLVDRLGDKAQHMLAFGTLTILAAAGWRGAELLRIGERLSFAGALIEVLQSIPALGRDCDIRDWLADTTVIVAVLVVVRLARAGDAQT